MLIFWSGFLNHLINHNFSTFNNLESASCDEANACCGADAAADCCTDGNPCSEGEGGCQGDNNCKGDLVCGSENCDASHGFASGIKSHFTSIFIFGLTS